MVTEEETTNSESKTWYQLLAHRCRRESQTYRAGEGSTQTRIFGLEMKVREAAKFPFACYSRETKELINYAIGSKVFY